MKYPFQAVLSAQHNLLSLFDMLRFYAASFISSWNNLQILECNIATTGIAEVFEGTDSTWADIQERLRETLAELAKNCKKLPMSATMAAQIERAASEVRVGNSAANYATLARLVEIRKNFVSELTEHYFLAIPSQRRRFYWDNGSTFGNAVDDTFPEATKEIKAANRCFALDEWTACVFHLMRALEIALHKWAKDLGVTQFSAMELENWKNILDAAEKNIKAIEQQPKSSTKDAELKYYGETIGHFRSVKDAWRNHVVHARETYDEGNAISAMNHIREFMTLLAARP